MKLIKVIKDDYFKLESKEMTNPKTRIGARGIVINENNEIAIFYKQNKNEYKLPGGGVEENETPKQAFLREILEETGTKVETIKELGTIEEHKSHDNFKQISYVYVSKVVNETKKLNLTQKEIAEGSKVLWMNPNEALLKVSECINNLIASEYENIYHTKFIVTRDKFILEEYLNAIN